MSRRRGSATALKASEVVAARGMSITYTHVGICQGLFIDLRQAVFFSRRPEQSVIRLTRWNPRRTSGGAGKENPRSASAERGGVTIGADRAGRFVSCCD